MNELAWNPRKCNEFALGGSQKLLSVWNLEERSSRTGKLRCSELEVPPILCELRPTFDFTAVCYSAEETLLFAATSFGVVTAWSGNTCFLNWQADTHEIGVLVSVKQRLITGSAKGNLKLWNVSSVHEMRRSDVKKASLRLDGLTVDSEVELKSGIKCCQFDEALEVGIATTTKGK